MHTSNVSAYLIFSSARFISLHWDFASLIMSRIYKYDHNVCVCMHRYNERGKEERRRRKEKKKSEFRFFFSSRHRSAHYALGRTWLSYLSFSLKSLS